MKKLMVFTLPLLINAFTGSAQETVTRSLPPFSRLYVADKITVDLIKADHESVTINAQGIDPSAIQTTIENNTLKIGKAGSPFDKNKVMVKLKFRELSEMEIANMAEATTTSLFKADSLSVIVKGGVLYLDADLKYLKSHVAGGGMLSAEGYATRHDIVVTTYSTVSAYNLESETVNIKATSGGKAKINVESELNAQASSGAYISYKGQPSEKNINASSGTQVEEYEE
ncbi:MAG: DUF2807 domain-containing protein [Bacteroidales bacterium]|nr:DUF2807 domain-containing protein [Bacteroidales bacterium]